MKRPLDQLAEIAQKAVVIGNDLIKRTRPQAVTEKSDRDTYTDVDVRIEHEVRAYLAKVTPDFGFVGEEDGSSNHATDRQYIWMLDPIDGTANFVHGVPLCGVSIALMRDDQAITAAISLPYLDLHYSATQGQGAYVNGKTIEASKTTELSKAMIAIGDYALGEGAERKNRERIALTTALAAQVERIRMFGSAAHDLTWLAEGRIDGTVILSNKAYDVAAGVLIAREAKALVLDSTGGQHTTKSTHTIAVTPGIADDLIRLIRSSI